MEYKKLNDLVEELNKEVIDDRNAIKEFIIAPDENEKLELYKQEYIISQQMDGIAEPYHREEGEKLRLYAINENIIALEPLNIEYEFIDIWYMNILSQLKGDGTIKELLKEYLEQFSNGTGKWKDK